jgi:predicted nucleic acid-binding protein
VLVVDASCLYEALTDSSAGAAVRRRLGDDPDQFAPHVVDVEVFGVIRRCWLRGELDDTAAALAVTSLREWPGERVPHAPLLTRAWELRASVRGWDAVYVALAELLGSPLLTLDRRLATATGPRCPVELPA